MNSQGRTVEKVEQRIDLGPRGHYGERQGTAGLERAFPEETQNQSDYRWIANARS